MNRINTETISIKATVATTVLLLCAGLGGCATSAPEPTHRWEASAGVVDEVRYRNDDARCQARAGISTEGGMESGSEGFQNYKNCMNQQGYTLTAYANSK